MTSLSRSRIAVAWLCVAPWLIACGGAETVRRAPAPAAPRFAGLYYPVAAPLPDMPPPGEPPPPQPFDDGAEPRDLGNAAVRDLENMQLVRRYFHIAEAIYAVSKEGVGNESLPPADYDPVPLARLHAQRLAELAQLALRAGALADRWRQLANEMAIPIEGDSDDTGRSGRLRLFHQLASCMADDSQARTDHGMAYLRALQTGGTDAVFRHTAPAGVRHAADLRLLARTLSCTRTASRTFR